MDIDGAKASDKHVGARKGYAPIGERACKFVFRISDKHLSVFCAFATRGFAAWEIYEGNTNNLHVSDFIRRKVGPKLGEDTCLLLDNFWTSSS